MSSAMTRSFGLGRRLLSTTARRWGAEGAKPGYFAHPAPGSNMPFDFNNKYAFTVKAILYFGTAVWIPFYVVRHQMKRAVSA